MKTINDKLLKEFGDKKLLFLENDYRLYHSVGNFYKWVIENKIKHNALFCVEKLPLDYVMDQIDWWDVIVFETQWVGETAYILKEKIALLKEPKIILECYCYEPSWYSKPKGVVHTVFTLECSEDNNSMEDWELTKLKSK